MPCHAMPCHAMPCHAMPCHAMHTYAHIFNGTYSFFKSRYVHSYWCCTCRCLYTQCISTHMHVMYQSSSSHINPSFAFKTSALGRSCQTVWLEFYSYLVTLNCFGTGLCLLCPELRPPVPFGLRCWEARRLAAAGSRFGLCSERVGTQKRGVEAGLSRLLCGTLGGLCAPPVGRKKCA